MREADQRAGRAKNIVKANDLAVLKFTRTKVAKQGGTGGGGRAWPIHRREAVRRRNLLRALSARQRARSVELKPGCARPGQAMAE